MVTEITITHVVSGFLGGLVREIVGITKYKSFTPDKFKWQYFLVSLLVASIVGITSGIIADGDWRISFLAGYAGTDFLENLYKLKFKEFFKS